MKKVVFTITSLFLLTALAQGQNATSPTAVATSSVTPGVAGNAEMTFETEAHDFGTIEHAAYGTYEFKFKNTGTDPLIITDAKGSCGCTVPTYPKDVPIMPGQSQIIKVTYDTKRVGSFIKTVTIHSNTKKHVDVLTIKGFVNPEPSEEVFPIGKSDKGATPFESH